MNTLFVDIFIICFLATLIRSTFGFGESLVAVPLLSFFMPINIAVPLSVLISVFVALVVVVQDHRQIELQSAKWLILFAIPGIPIGLALLLYGNEHWVKICLGLFIIAYALYSLFGKNVFHLKKDHQGWLFICGLLSGIMGGAYGINGPPLAVYGNLRKWDAKTFRATLQGYFLPASFVGLTAYFYKGLISKEVLYDFAISLPAVIPAIFIGRYLNKKLEGRQFFRYVYVGLLLIGLLLILLNGQTK